MVISLEMWLKVLLVQSNMHPPARQTFRKRTPCTDRLIHTDPITRSITWHLERSQKENQCVDHQTTHHSWKFETQWHHQSSHQHVPFQTHPPILLQHQQVPRQQSSYKRKSPLFQQQIEGGLFHHCRYTKNRRGRTFPATPRDVTQSIRASRRRVSSAQHPDFRVCMSDPLKQCSESGRGWMHS